ncbi:hypothetical protein LCGC14_2801910, partial [marine sediment metagenome]
VKQVLDKMKMFERETYNEVIENMLEDNLELNEKTKKEIEQARQNKTAKYNAYQFEGTIKVLVARLHPSSMIMYKLNAGNITQKSLFERCDKTLTIAPPLASHMRGPAYMNKEATVNLKIEGRKCVATSVVFDAQ